MTAAADPTVPAVGPRVKALREAMDLSLRDLAERSGVSAPMLSQVERGETSPTLQTAARIAAGLELRLSQLLRLDEGGTGSVGRRGGARRGGGGGGSGGGGGGGGSAGCRRGPGGGGGGGPRGARLGGGGPPPARPGGRGPPAIPSPPEPSPAAGAPRRATSPAPARPP